jgi:hypothetical protein
MVIYNGPSQIDGKPIVAIITGVTSKSKNSKTGEMPQVWIIRSDIHPTEALRSGEDYSICGNCPHRPQELGDNALKKSIRSCYVNTMSFNAVFKKYSNGGYPVVELSTVAEMLQGMNIRLGAYGDPAAVPLSVWVELCKYCKSTGYTHQWRTCDPGYAQYCQASCDNLLDVVQSTAKGYRTFFVQKVDKYNEVVRQYEGIKFAHCPASKEMNKVTTCSSCMACSGTRSGLKSNVTIMIH